MIIRAKFKLRRYPRASPKNVVSALIALWVAVMLSGSDTSGNALFGNLRVVAARQLGLDPVPFAATNSSGGV